jgi:hypothetical protein
MFPSFGGECNNNTVKMYRDKINCCRNIDKEKLSFWVGKSTIGI